MAVWYARIGTGAAVGPGTRRPWQTTPGASVSTQDLTSEHSWNWVSATPQTIPAGAWSISAWITTGSAKGPAPRVTASIYHYSSTGTLKATLYTVQSGNLTAPGTSQVTWDPAIGDVVLEAGDVISIGFVRSNGSHTTALRFNGTGDASTQSTNPDPITVETKAHVAWVELETPEAATIATYANMAWVELETPEQAPPADPTLAQISWVEFDISGDPDPPAIPDITHVTPWFGSTLVHFLPGSGGGQVDNFEATTGTSAGGTAAGTWSYAGAAVGVKAAGGIVEGWLDWEGVAVGAAPGGLATTTQRFAPDAILDVAFLSGTVTVIQDDPDSPDADWLVS